MATDIFETCARFKLRFPSTKGELTAENLFELPLTRSGVTRSGMVDLDSVAQGINKLIKDEAEESFVSSGVNTRKKNLELRLEVVKRVIAIKIEERDAAKAANDKKAERKKLVDALAVREQTDLASMDKEALLKRLAELD